MINAVVTKLEKTWDWFGQVFGLAQPPGVKKQEYLS